MAQYFLKKEVITLISVRPELIDELEAEGLIHPEPDERFSEAEVERMRIMCNLIDDLGINLAGVEVIMQMREELLESHRIFNAVVRQLLERLPRDSF